MLDVDVTTGYGPEIFASAKPASGTYQVWGNYFGGGGGGDGGRAALTVAQVSIISNENTPSEKQQTFRIPMRGPGELTLVKAFVFPGSVFPAPARCVARGGPGRGSLSFAKTHDETVATSGEIPESEPTWLERAVPRLEPIGRCPIPLGRT